MTALVAAVLVVGCVAAVAVSLSALRGFELWLSFRRERAVSQPEGELVARVKALEEKATAAELQKLRR